VLKILSYLVKRDGMAIEEFVEYYENHHVPLILSLGPHLRSTNGTTCSAVTR